jgi:hypothetical protein
MMFHPWAEVGYWLFTLMCILGGVGLVTLAAAYIVKGLGDDDDPPRV